MKKSRGSKTKRFFKFKALSTFLAFFGALILGLFFFFIQSRDLKQENNIISRVNLPILDRTSPTPTQIPLQAPTQQKVLENNYHIFQSFNNCGPASLSMALSYYGINKSQAELGEALRPYQVAGGDNDDKSVTLEELAEKSREYGFVPFHRPNGNMEMIKSLITYDIPVITRTWLHLDDDIGHYRVVKGYDEENKQIIQDDSFENKNLRYSYADFNEIWKKFNYEYLVLIPEDKIEIAKQILGEDYDSKTSWTKAVKNAQQQLSENPNDIYARFNLSVALYNIGEFKRSTEEFEKVENNLSFRTLWYQIEPIEAYYELGNYSRVFEITDKILNNQNRAFSELYIIRGNIYLKQGNKDAARAEFEKAVLYNKNMKAAQEALAKTQN